MNHCRLVTISTGRSPFSKNFTARVTGVGSPISSPDCSQQLDDPFARLVDRAALQLAVARARALEILATPSPASPHGTSSRRPSAPSTERTGRPSSRHHVTSVRSPNVQTITRPVPFSGSTSGCVSTGTRVPNSGVSTSRPTSAR